MTAAPVPSTTPHSTPLSNPHAASAEEVAMTLEVDPAQGLSSEEARTRLDRFGPNQLAEPVRRPVLLRFLDQFRSVLILVLIGAAVLAGLVGEIKDTIVIAVVLLINASIGFFQEQRAEKSLEALRNMLSPSARIRRDGRTLVVDAGDLVPGDVVLLEAGDRVPADARQSSPPRWRSTNRP
ncbi:cation-transporting P-type ATPase [Janibacter terrae]